MQVFSRVNVGCGPTLLPGYVNMDVDGSHFEGMDPDRAPWQLTRPMVHDVTNGLPFRDGSMVEVRADQFLEHLHAPESVRFIEEAHRVLMDGGELRLSFPDIGEVAKGVPQAHLDRWKDTTAGYTDLGWPEELAYLNLMAYHWGHQQVLTLGGVLPLVESRFRVLHSGHTLTTAHIIAVKGGAPNSWRTSGR